MLLTPCQTKNKGHGKKNSWPNFHIYLAYVSASSFIHWLGYKFNFHNSMTTPWWLMVNPYQFIAVELNIFVSQISPLSSKQEIFCVLPFSLVQAPPRHPTKPPSKLGTPLWVPQTTNQSPLFVSMPNPSLAEAKTNLLQALKVLKLARQLSPHSFTVRSHENMRL